MIIELNLARDVVSLLLVSSVFFLYGCIVDKNTILTQMMISWASDTSYRHAFEKAKDRVFIITNQQINILAVT